MTRRRFHAPPDSFNATEQTVTLGGDEARHLRDVLRLKPGDEVYVFDGRGRAILEDVVFDVRQLANPGTEGKVFE